MATLLKLDPLDIADHLFTRFGYSASRSAALDYRASLHSPGTSGYNFWTQVIQYLTDCAAVKKAEAL